MNTAELNANFTPAVLYYCDSKSDTNRYFDPDDLNNLSVTVGTANVDGNGDTYVDEWNMGYAKPSQTDLKVPTLATVLTFWEQKYVQPVTIINQNAASFKSMTSTEISNMETALMLPGYIIHNSTSGKLQYFNSGWNNLW